MWKFAHLPWSSRRIFSGFKSLQKKKQQQNAPLFRSRVCDPSALSRNKHRRLYAGSSGQMADKATSVDQVRGLSCCPMAVVRWRDRSQPERCAWWQCTAGLPAHYPLPRRHFSDETCSPVSGTSLQILLPLASFAKWQPNSPHVRRTQFGGQTDMDSNPGSAPHQLCDLNLSPL